MTTPNDTYRAHWRAELKRAEDGIKRGGEMREWWERYKAIVIRQLRKRQKREKAS